jgi:hypothetical protein
MTRVSLKLTNSLGAPVTVAVEPWAHEFELPAGSTFEVVTHDAGADESLSVILAEGLATIWVNSGSVVSAMLDGTDVWP